MQIKRKALVILRVVALGAGVLYLFYPAAAYKALFLSIVWFCIGVNFSTMLPIWEKSPETGSGTKVLD